METTFFAKIFKILGAKPPPAPPFRRPRIQVRMPTLTDKHCFQCASNLYAINHTWTIFLF